MELPQKNDKLFKAESSPDVGAWLKAPANKFFLYSEGYKSAGDTLFEHCIANPFFNNSLVYPLIFTYRQFVELKLKEIITMGNKLNEIAEDFPDEHNILKLWKLFRYEIYPNISSENKELFDNAEKILEQFHLEDPHSMNFRYPLTKGPIRRDSLNRDTIDLKNLKDVIEKLYNFLNSLWDEISHYQDMKDEMIQEYYSQNWY